MKLARVQGTVVCTIKHPTYEGRRLMLCALLDVHGNPTGKQEIAVDLVQAGVGDRVLIMSEGNGVRQLLGANAGPIRDVIVGVVDLLSVDHLPQTQNEPLDRDPLLEKELQPSSPPSLATPSTSQASPQNIEIQDVELPNNMESRQKNLSLAELEDPLCSTLEGAS